MNRRIVPTLAVMAGILMPGGSRVGARVAPSVALVRPRVVGHVQARTREKGKWRNKLTSLRKGASGIALR